MYINQNLLHIIAEQWLIYKAFFQTLSLWENLQIILLNLTYNLAITRRISQYFNVLFSILHCRMFHIPTHPNPHINSTKSSEGTVYYDNLLSDSISYQVSIDILSKQFQKAVVDCWLKWHHYKVSIHDPHISYFWSAKTIRNDLCYEYYIQSSAILAWFTEHRSRTQIRCSIYLSFLVTPEHLHSHSVGMELYVLGLPRITRYTCIRYP